MSDRYYKIVNSIRIVLFRGNIGRYGVVIMLFDLVNRPFYSKDSFKVIVSRCINIFIICIRWER